jgi:hypothetical protein
MSPEQFAMWLDGFMAGAGAKLTAEQLEAVRQKMLMVKVSPAMPQFVPVPYQVPFVPAPMPIFVPTPTQPWPTTLPPIWYGDLQITCPLTLMTAR